MTLRCEHLTVRLDGHTILREIDLGIPEGTMTALVGPSGAGKTTLLRATAGLTPVSAGRLLLGGRDLVPVPVHRRRVAMVFQQPRLLPNLDVAENVALPGRLAGVPADEREREAARLLDEVGLPGSGSRWVTGLSGGEQQRVSLARALAARPDLLLLDEPLSAVDPDRRASLRRLVRRIQHDHGLTALYVTHDRNEAAELGDRVAVLIEGRVLAHAPPEELFERPPSAVLARFVGASNLLTGEVRDGRLHLPTGTLPVDAPDGPATAALRPEHLVLSDRGDPPTGVGGDLHAEITGVAYRASHLEVRLDAAGTKLEAHLATDADVRTGQRVRLAARRTWVLPRSDADTRAGRP